MTSNTKCSPNFESLAAYIDGTLGSAERLALEAHLANCDTCIELLAEAHETAGAAAFLEELPDLVPSTSEPATVSESVTEVAGSISSKSTSRALESASKNGRWPRLLIAAGLLAAIGASWWWMARVPGLQSLTSAELLAELPSADNLREDLPDGWIDGRWSVMRGEAVMIAPRKAAFRLGARAVDLAGALRANALEDARKLTYRLDDVIRSITGGEMLMISNHFLRQALENSPANLDAVNELAAKLDAQIAELEPADYLQAGRWAATAHLAALAGTKEFFASKTWQEGLELLSATDAKSELSLIAKRLEAVEPTDFVAIREEIGLVFSILGQAEETL